ncbi:tRNA (cytidine(34)-2'-O)-methyltransferase [Psychrobacter sp. I-STPA6b]|uniref:tRNA (cytidine(34)-2'-O)-methyltransferase n=1 Tax=Psychrobacter sp. I-STPA6b TaxID=2585718 RepID=UPI001D0C96B6|nr:tRNA (cytidine(34)-2'-O)-methyltransferase [Psychrobacter sp. I-STPA6b]
MSIHIVLVHPKMPSNTGNIIRLCANTGAKLHLVEPLGFELEDKKLRRAGLDYHEYAHLNVHKDWKSAYHCLKEQGCDTVVALTTKLSLPFYEYNFDMLSQKRDTDKSEHEMQSQTRNVALVFGSETAGLSEEVRTDIGTSNWLRLPMLPDSRSLNLANTVAICLYEVWRQQGFVGDMGASVGYEDLTPYDPK